MLRSKYILLIILWFVGAQLFASQVLCDSLSTDTIELADAEFEAWLDKYAKVREIDSLPNVSDSLTQKRDFVELVGEGEEARKREKNALISSVMASLNDKMQSEELVVKDDSISVLAGYMADTLVGYDFVELLNRVAVDSILATAIDADSLLAEVDSQRVVLNVQHSADVNSLFMDWILGDVEQGREYGIWSDDSVVVEVRKEVKEYIRATEPELYAYHKSQLPSITELQMGRIQYDKRDKLLLNLDSLNKARTSNLKVDLPEMSKWSKGAKFQVHASQNYISSNWYKGGESNMAMTMYAMGYFNYDNRKGLQWDNKAEWKLGLYGMSSDSLRWLRVNEDLLRLNSKLGYKAFKKFFYTAEWDFQTSLFNTYKSNTYIRSSGPFSPIRMSLSLGMDYKWNSVVSVFVSPLSYKLVYVADMSYKDGVLPEENIAHQVGITDGTRQSNQLGALVRTDFDYDFNESIGMEVHFSFFGNYVGKIKGVEVGCEVIGNFKINRFLSAKVSLYPRYDSTTIPADGGKPKMQFYELISLGFNYKL